MVDPIASKVVTGGDRSVAPVTRIVAPPAAAPVATPAEASANAAQAAPQLTTLAASLSSEAPVDTDRIARIKKAIADGTFPIYPSKIADRLIALKYDWTPHDDAA